MIESGFYILNKYSAIMKNAKDHGNKPAARAFKTTVKTVRKWRKRYEEEKYKGGLAGSTTWAVRARLSNSKPQFVPALKGLEDRSHAPKNPATYISDEEKAFVL